MKKLVSIILVVLLAATCIFAQGKKEEKTLKTEVVVFAAASMQESLTQIGNNFMAENPDITLVFNFDSSGTLKTQIQNGAVCDIFVSASPKQMNQLENDYIDKETRFDLLENKVALAVPKGNPKGIRSFEELINALINTDVLLAMGNSDVPVGQYTQKIFKYFNIDEEAMAKAGCLTYGSNVKEVTTQVSESAVDCGIIYKTDAFSAGLEVVDTATKEMCGQVIYPAAMLKNSANKDQAARFLSYLKGAKASEVLSSIGFTPLSK